MTSSIPFIGIPVLNRGDLLKRCVESIDMPVDHLVIVNNGNDAGVAAVLRDLAGSLPESIHTFGVYEPGYNLGVAASWNWLCAWEHVATPPDAPVDIPYRMLVGNDMQFLPGALATFDEFTRRHLVTHAMVRCFQGYGVIALTRRGIQNVGGFDESIYPAYFEDNDHHMRLRLLGERDTDVSIPLIHGEHGQGSCTIKSDQAFSSRNGAAFGHNYAYYVRKWGGAPHHETFQHPFNDPAQPVNGWRRDEEHYQRNFKIINDNDQAHA